MGSWAEDAEVESHSYHILRGDFRCQCERDCGKEMCVLLTPGKAATLSRPAEVRLSLPRTVCVSSLEFFCLGDASLLHGFLIQPLALTCMGVGIGAVVLTPQCRVYSPGRRAYFGPRAPSAAPPAFGSPCCRSLVLSTSVLCDPTNHSRSSCTCPARVLG